MESAKNKLIGRRWKDKARQKGCGPLITKVFREAMMKALARETGRASLADACPWLAEALPLAEREGVSMDALLPVCWVIEYNETIPEEEKSPEQVIRLLNVKTHQELAEQFPALFRALAAQKSGKTAFENLAYQVFIKYFKETEFDGRSIVRIGLGLRMTVEEMNLILLSYGKQTISWHRVDDLLFRYAVGKKWTYGRFARVYEEYLAYRAQMEQKELTGGAENKGDGKPALLQSSEKRRDSAYMTRFNQQKLQSILNDPRGYGDDSQVYKTLHAYFIETEKTAGGAPRRAMAKICRWAHGDFSLAYAAHLLDKEDGGKLTFGECTDTKAQTAYQMVMEAAGEDVSARKTPDPQDARERVNRIIRAVNDLCGGFKTASHPPLPEGIDLFGGRTYFDALRQWKLPMLLTEGSLRDGDALRLIAECLYRDLPQEYQALGEISQVDGDWRHADAEMILKAAGIAVNRTGDLNSNRFFEGALRRGVFHLLLCCGSGKARRMLNETVADVLKIFGFSVWDGNMDGRAAEELIEKLRALSPAPQTADGEKKKGPFCSGVMQKEIKSFLSQCAPGKAGDALYSRLESAGDGERKQWISAYLNKKGSKALSVLGYTPEQKQAFAAQWRLLTPEEREYCLFNILRPQYVTERDINEPIGFTLNISRGWKKSAADKEGEKPRKRDARLYIELGKRNSEPSRNLILLMALAMFGFVAEKDERGFTFESCERYISDCVKNAWGAAWQLSETDDELDETLETIMKNAFLTFSALKKDPAGADLPDMWRRALTAACREYRAECRNSEIQAMGRAHAARSVQALRTRNRLFDTVLIAGQWKYDRERKKG